MFIQSSEGGRNLTPVNRFQYITTHPTLWMFLDARYDNSFITRRSFGLDHSAFSNMSPNPRARGAEKYYTLSKSNSNVSTIPIPVCCCRNSYRHCRRLGHQHPKAISVKIVLFLTEYTGKHVCLDIVSNNVCILSMNTAKKRRKKTKRERREKT